MKASADADAKASADADAARIAADAAAREAAALRREVDAARAAAEATESAMRLEKAVLVRLMRRSLASAASSAASYETTLSSLPTPPAWAFAASCAASRFSQYLPSIASVRRGNVTSASWFICRAPDVRARVQAQTLCWTDVVGFVCSRACITAD